MTSLESDSDYDDKAHARTTDPITSHIAAKLINVSDIENNILVALFDAGNSGLHQGEVTERMGGLHERITPRFAPMKRKGLIELTGRLKLDRNSWRKRQVWRITEKGKQRCLSYLKTVGR